MKVMRMLNKQRTIQQLLQEWQYDEELKQNIVGWHTIDAKEADYADFPATLHTSIKKALNSRGMEIN